MPIDIDGTIIGGYGAAHTTLAKQLPLFLTVPGFQDRLPLIATCHAGTINVQLDEALLVPPSSMDFVTPPIEWDPQPQPPEQFGFLRIEFECPRGGPRHPALFYVAFNSPHRGNPFTQEVIAPHIPAATTGTQCHIHIPNRQPKQLIVVGL